MNKDRISALIDGVYAFAMTLLIVTIEFPQASDNETLKDVLISDGGKALTYVLSFAILASFWMVSHKLFEIIGKVNEKFCWMNLWSLLFIVFIPFSTDLVNNYDNSLLAISIFHINLFFVGIFNYFLFFYVKKHPELKAEEYKDGKINMTKTLVSPIVSLIGLLLACFIFDWNLMIYIMLPIIINKFDNDKK